MKNSKRPAVRYFALILALLTLLAFLCACQNEKPPVTQPPSTNDGGDTTTPPDDNGNGDNNDDPAPEILYLSNKELAAELSSSVWKTDKLLGNDKKIGLTDPSNVGIDKDKWENEVLYPIPAESEFVKIFNAEDYGVSADSDNNYHAITDILKEAKEVKGLKYIKFPAGKYKLAGGLTFDDVDDCYFGGEDVTFVGTKWFAMFSIRDCENLHFNGLTIEFDPTPNVSGTILSYAKGEVVVKVNEGFDISNPIYTESLTKRDMVLMEFKYDELTGRYVPRGGGNGTEDYITGYGAGNVTIDADANTVTFRNAGSLKKMDEGTVVNLMFTGKVGICFQTHDCKNVYWEDVTIYSNPGMGFVFNSTENAYLNNMNMTFKPDTNELMTATSDGLHVASMSGELIVTNCSFLGSLDDCLNVKTSYHTILGASGKKITVKSSTLPFEVGDVLEIFNPGDLSTVATYTIKKIDEVGSSFEFTVDRRVEGDILNYKLANISKTVKLTLKNSLLGNKRNRGVMLQVRDSVIVNNTFINFVHGALSIHSVADQYGEAVVPRNITVENNKFIGGYGGDLGISSWGSSGSTPGVIYDIYVRNNFFANYTGNAMGASGAGKVYIENNMFYNICTKLGDPDSNARNLYAIGVKICENMYVNYNLCYTDVEYKQFQIVPSDKSLFAEKQGNLYKYGED